MLLMPEDDMQRELIRGVLTEDVLPRDQHGVVVARIGWLLGNFSDDNDYGEVSGSPVSCWSATRIRCAAPT